MIVCPKCGAELPDGTKFCIKCGAPQNAEKPAEEPKKEEAKKEEPKKEEAKKEEPKKEEAKKEAPKKEEAKKEAPKKEEAKKEAPKKEEAKKEEPKKEEAKKEEAKKEEPKKEEAKKEEPKKEEAKKEEAKKDEATADEPKKGLDPKLIKYLGIAAAAVVVLIIFICLLSGGKKGNKAFALYVKDKELMYSSNFKGKKATQISTKLVKEGGVTNADVYDVVDGNLNARLTKDGKYLFYRDKIENSDDGATIYYKDLTKLKKESVKMDSSVRSYTINESSTIVTYLKTDGNLWQFNIKKGEKAESKVAKNVRTYYVSDDGSKIIYTQREDGITDIRMWTKKADEKLEGDIQRLSYVADDFKTIYYVKNDSLCKKVGKKDKEKIDSDVQNVYRIYENGNAYYTKDNDGDVALYFYNGKEAKKILDDVNDSLDASASSSSKTPILVIKDNSSVDACIFVKDTKKDLDLEKVTGIAFDPNGKAIYLLADYNSENNCGTLYKAAISGNKVGKIEKYDEDVYRSFRCTSDGHVIYYKDAKGGKGEMFCDKKKVDDDVYTGYVIYEQKQMVYYVDFNSGKGYGTLKVAKAGGKAKQVADEVVDFVVLPNGNILYLNDFNTKSCEGSLYLFKGSKSTLVDEEVTAIIDIW